MIELLARLFVQFVMFFFSLSLFQWSRSAWAAIELLYVKWRRLPFHFLLKFSKDAREKIFPTELMSPALTTGSC